MFMVTLYTVDDPLNSVESMSMTTKGTIGYIVFHIQRQVLVSIYHDDDDDDVYDFVVDL